MKVRGPTALQVTRTVTSGPEPATSDPSSPSTVKPTSPIAFRPLHTFLLRHGSFVRAPVKHWTSGLRGARRNHAYRRDCKIETSHCYLLKRTHDLNSQVNAASKEKLRISTHGAPILYVRFCLIENLTGLPTTMLHGRSQILGVFDHRPSRWLTPEGRTGAKCAHVTNLQNGRKGHRPFKFAYLTNAPIGPGWQAPDFASVPGFR
jgi:hypothetical protein